MIKLLLMTELSGKQQSGVTAKMINAQKLRVCWPPKLSSCSFGCKYSLIVHLL